MLLARLLLAAVFLLAGAAKLYDIAGSRAAIISFGVPASLATSLGVVLPVIELLVALALIPVATARVGAIAAFALLAIFIAGISSLMLRGREAECHCFGQLHSSRVGWPTLFRNAVLAAVALFVIAGAETPSSARMFTSFSRFGTLGLVGLISVAIACFSAWFMIHLLRQHGRLLLRLDALEQQLVSRGVLISPAIVSAPNGLAVGVKAPRFALPGIDGLSLSLDQLLEAARPLVLVFSHPGCPPCNSMLPAVRAWQVAHKSSLIVAFVSQGTVEGNASATELGIEHILLQQESEIADSFQAYGTPSAVLISADGLIASTVVQGETAIRVLVDSVVSAAAPDAIKAGRNADALDERGASWRDNGASIPGLGLNAR